MYSCVVVTNVADPFNFFIKYLNCKLTLMISTIDRIICLFDMISRITPNHIRGRGQVKPYHTKFYEKCPWLALVKQISLVFTAFVMTNT